MRSMEENQQRGHPSPSTKCAERPAHLPGLVRVNSDSGSECSFASARVCVGGQSSRPFSAVPKLSPTVPSPKFPPRGPS